MCKANPHNQTKEPQNKYKINKEEEIKMPNLFTQFDPKLSYVWRREKLFFLTKERETL
jgi:hypothetical protein